MNPLKIIEKFYRKDTDLCRLLLLHSNQVAQKAVAVCTAHPELQADVDFVYQAAMLHDIGIFLCHAPKIFCKGSHHYIEHGYLGSQLLENENFPRHALVAERHTGTGITLNEILERNLPLPPHDMQPQSIEEQIVCYADKFFSKSNPQRELTLAEICNNLAKFGTDKVLIFENWHKKFDICKI